jgi:hypothetical protein
VLRADDALDERSWGVDVGEHLELLSMVASLHSSTTAERVVDNEAICYVSDGVPDPPQTADTN